MDFLASSSHAPLVHKQEDDAFGAETEEDIAPIDRQLRESMSMTSCESDLTVFPSDGESSVDDHNDPPTPHFDRSADVVLSLRDEAYVSVIEPHFREMWKERNDMDGQSTRERATGVFDDLRTRLKASGGGGFWKFRNTKLSGDGLYGGDNLYAVHDDDTVVESETMLVVEF